MYLASDCEGTIWFKDCKRMFGSCIFFEESVRNREKQMDLYGAFMDLNITYDRVDGDALWKVL